MKRIECIIMDWAGTAVDYGCFAPVAAFVESFRAIGVPVTAAETRAHMGLTKVEEIRALFDIERVRAEFERKFGRPAGEEERAGTLCRIPTGVVCLARSIIPTLFPVWWKRFPHCVRKASALAPPPAIPVL